MKATLILLALAFGLTVSYAQEIISNPNSSHISEEGLFVNSKGDRFNGFTQSFKHEHLKREEFTYKHGVKTGPAAIYYSNGIVKEYGNFVNNQRQGEWKTWDHSGNLILSVSYEKGKKHGLAYSFHKNGHKKCQMKYEMNTKSGKWFWWDKNGVLTKSVFFYY